MSNRRSLDLEVIVHHKGTKNFSSVLCILCAFVVFSLPQKDTKGSTASVYGRITINGRWAPGVIVQLLPFESITLQRNPIAETITDAEGSFRITEIPAGNYRIEALAPDCFMWDGLSWRPVKPISIRAGALERIDMALTQGGIVTGRVTWSDKEPVIGGTIRLSQIDENGQKQQYFPASYMSETDDRGIYRIYGLPTSLYKVGVTISFPGQSKSIKAFHPNVDSEDSGTVVRVIAGKETANVDITVSELVEPPKSPETFKVRGQIVDAETGQALPDFPFNYNSNLRGENSIGLGFNLRTNLRGEFQINGLSPGSYFIYASVDEGSSLYSEVVDFEVVDSNITGLVVSLHTGSSLSGKVVIDSPQDPKNFPGLADQEFIVSVTTATGRSSPVSFKPSEDGSFQVSGLPPGRAKIILSNYSNSGRFQSMRVERKEVEQNEIDIAPGEQVNDLRIVLFFNPGRIVGQVKFIGGTIPTTDRLMIFPRPVRAGGPSRSTQVASDGSFVIDYLTEGDYKLNFLNLNIMSKLPNQSMPNLLIWPELFNLRFDEVVTVTPGKDTKVTITFNLSQR